MKTLQKSSIALLFVFLQAALFAAPPAGQVVVWGSYSPDKAALETMTNIMAISAGTSDCLALKSDGTVIEWNSWHSTVPAGLSNVVAIASGDAHNLALKADGSVVGWGATWSNPAYGGTRLPIGISNIVAISAGFNSLALRKDGTMIGGLRNSSDELSNIVAIAASAALGGGDMALKQDGTVLMWDNRNGRPQVVEGLSNVVAIAAGDLHNLALKKDGTVYGWGPNSLGESIGVPTTTSPSYTNGLVRINGQVLNDVKAIAAGSKCSLALKNDGSLVLWGWNHYNRMNVSAGLSDVVAITIAARDDYCLAITTNSAVAEKILH